MTGRAGGGFGLGQTLISKTPQAGSYKHNISPSNVSIAEKKANDMMHIQMKSVINHSN